MNKTKAFFLACIVVVAFIAFVGWARPVVVEESVEPWHRPTVDCPPPDGRPIVGFWIWDGYPTPVVVVPIGSRYYAYETGGPTLLIAEYPPNYWIDMPGTVR